MIKKIVHKTVKNNSKKKQEKKVLCRKKKSDDNRNKRKRTERREITDKVMHRMRQRSQKKRMKLLFTKEEGFYNNLPYSISINNHNAIVLLDCWKTILTSGSYTQVFQMTILV